MKHYVITVAVIKNKEKYLIGKRASTKKFAPNQWEFISGFMDIPESPEETILREIKEELDSEGKIIDSSPSFEFTDNEGDWTVIPFLVELSTQEVRINPQDHSEIRWVNMNELNDYPDLEVFIRNEGIKKFLL